MKPLAQVLYGLSRLALFLLGVAFLSFWLLTLKLDFVKPVTEYGTRYVPILLLPVSVAMVAVLLLRWTARSANESVGLGDFVAFFLAIAAQLGTILLYRAQGAEIAGDFALNMPSVDRIVAKAEPYGMLGVAALQFTAFFLYWAADPDPKRQK